MESDFKSEPMIRAILRAYEHPDKGMSELKLMIDEARRNGRHEVMHALADNFVGASCKTGRYLGTAERFARESAKSLPDRHHLLRLAAVCELRGKKREATQARRRAARAPDLHMNDEIRAAIKQAEDELK